MKKCLLLILASTFIGLPFSFSQSASMVKDLNLASSGSNPHSIKDFNGIALFLADDKIHGNELWRSDGTEQGTWMVKDMVPGNKGIDHMTIEIVGSVCYIAIQKEDQSHALWKSDGTTNGTILIKDNQTSELTATGNGLYFISHEVQDTSDLYYTDTSTNDLQLIKRFFSPFRVPSSLFYFNNALYFSAPTDTLGVEIWSSDGTNNGTKIFKDLRLGDNSSYPTEFYRIGDKMVFFAQSTNWKYDIWESDGTEQGTEMVHGISNAAPSLYNFSVFQNPNDEKLFFLAEKPDGTFQLWSSDGTPSGTSNFHTFPKIPTVIKGEDVIYFILAENTSTYIFQTTSGFNDITQIGQFYTPGTIGSTKLSIFRTYGNDLYFTEYKDNKVFNWRFKYAENLMEKIPYSYYIAQVGSLTFFTKDVYPIGTELWATTSTLDQGYLVKKVNPLSLPSSPEYLYDIGTSIMFRANRTQLWRSDGSAVGTTILDSSLLNIQYMEATSYNGNYYFTKNSDNGQKELWASDGSESGTALVKEFVGTPYSIYNFMHTANDLYFASIHDGEYALWKTDGTNQGTIPLKYFDEAIQPLGKSIDFKGNLLFLAPSDQFQFTLWKSDGTAANTSILANHYVYTNSLNATDNNVFFFSYDDNASKPTLWKSNGTASTTAAFITYEGVIPSIHSTLNNNFYFIANDGNTGLELWKTNGSVQGTSLVKDISQNTESTLFYDMLTVDSLLFYVTKNQQNTYSLWKSDGTTAGTEELSTFQFLPKHLANIKGELFFSVQDVLHGTELWKSDGTTAGTSLFSDIFIGPNSSNPSQLIHSNGIWYFTAVNIGQNRELWAINPALSKIPTLLSNTTVSNLSIYPNPTTDILSVKSLNEEKISQITISNISGKIFWAQNYIDKASINIDINHLPKGIYLLHSKLENNTSSVQKIIVH